jgi:hypothetical protein
MTNIEDMTQEQLVSEIKSLRESLDWYRDRVVWGFHEDGEPVYYQGKAGEHEINDPITAETANKLIRSLNVYERERARFRHAHPEMTGAYFLAGGHGLKDDNQMPQFVEICPAYGAGWVKIYEDTGRTISYEGS